jgi:hypothetical protein
VTCCQHCPTLTDEEREDIAFRETVKALRSPRRINVSVLPLETRVVSTVTISQRYGHRSPDRPRGA